jgi:glycosyltransferase involved in cell wall biosynthesis
MDEHGEAYRQIVALSPQIRLIDLEQTPNGHGPSYAINRGAELARGEYLCFLDDDDLWTDPDHLERAWQVLARDSADLYLSNQAAFAGEDRVEGPLWLSALAPAIRQSRPADPQGSHAVDVDTLMTFTGFPHLNNTIARRSLYQATGGMDENIRYECEWDLYFKLIDAARRIRYFPGIVSRHNVPDKRKTTNASTAVTDLQKLLYRLTVMDKAMLFRDSPAIARCARQVKTVTLKHIASHLAASGRTRLAHTYAREALALKFSFKWLAYCGLLGMRSCFSSANRLPNPESRPLQ